MYFESYTDWGSDCAVAGTGVVVASPTVKARFPGVAIGSQAAIGGENSLSRSLVNSGALRVAADVVAVRNESNFSLSGFASTEVSGVEAEAARTRVAASGILGSRS